MLKGEKDLESLYVYRMRTGALQGIWHILIKFFCFSHLFIQYIIVEQL